MMLRCIKNASKSLRPNQRREIAFVVLLAFSFLSAALSWAQGTGGTGTGGSGSTADFSQVRNALGVQGMEENGVLKVTISRNDIQPKKDNAPVSPDLVAHGEVAFWPATNFTVTPATPAAGTGGTSTGAFNGMDPFGVANAGASLTAAGGPWFVMTAEVPLLESELPAFLKVLQGSDITKAAIHNHDVMINPVLIYVHLEGVVNTPRMEVLKKAIATTGIGQLTDEPMNSVKGLDQNQLQTILGGKAEGSMDVVSVEIPRPEQFSSCLPAMAQSLYNRQMSGGALNSGAANGVSAGFQANAACETAAQQAFTTTNATSGTSGATITNTILPNELLAFSEISFQSLGGGAALVDGELAVLAPELELTEASLGAQGFDISAVHNHSASESPRLFFIHFSKQGDAVAIAKVIRAIMDQNLLTAGRISSVSNFQ